MCRRTDRPYAPIVFWAFRVMVGLGFADASRLGFYSLWLRWKRPALRGRAGSCGLPSRMTPVGFVAFLAGWFTTESRTPALDGLWPAAHGRQRHAGADRQAPSLTSLVAFIVGLRDDLHRRHLLHLLRLRKLGPVRAQPRSAARGRREAARPKRPLSAARRTASSRRSDATDGASTCTLIWTGIIAFARVHVRADGRLRSRPRHPVPVRAERPATATS